MSGGLELTSYTSELSNYFEDGKEIVLYKTNEEMIDKAKFYLDSKNHLVVKKLKANARYRAENEHTWTNRFSKIFENLSL
jgi:spore maturation protein CgeB